MSNKLTIMIVPDSTSKVRRFRVARATLWAVVSVLALSVGAIVASSLYYCSVIDQLAENSRIKKENLALKNKLIFVHKKVASAQVILDRIQRFTTKLKTITNLNDSKRHLALGPFDTGNTQVEIEELGVVDPVVLAISERPQMAIGLLGNRLDELTAEARQREGSIRQLETFLRGQKSRLASTPSIHPTRGWVTSRFGMRRDPYTGKQTMHRGLDIANQVGVAVVSPARGVITFAGLSGGFGNVIVIDHGYGIRTRYAHLSEIGVRTGIRVNRGDRIGSIGNSGRSTGPHLHYEVEVNGVCENPSNYILD
jgi:murein DD-endopeptidase MepM/ murein hydrolase activator NlpD